MFIDTHCNDQEVDHFSFTIAKNIFQHQQQYDLTLYNFMQILRYLCGDRCTDINIINNKF